MSFDTVFLLLVRWLHGLAALIWVGGSLFYLLVLKTGLAGAVPSVRRRIGENFGAVVEVCAIVLLITGVILTFSRLTSGFATVPYGITLGIKIALAFYLFWLVWLRRRAAQRRGWRSAVDLTDEPPLPGRIGRMMTSTTAIAIIGVVIVFLADVLRLIVEQGLAGKP